MAVRLSALRTGRALFLTNFFRDNIIMTGLVEIVQVGWNWHRILSGCVLSHQRRLTFGLCHHSGRCIIKRMSLILWF
jgi:hypothetical protein